MTIHNVNLFYGDFHALKNVDLDIPEKKITAFIGPSGCGKSTLLKSLNRMNDLVEGCKITGDIRLDGEDIYGDMDVNLLRKRVGMVFQKPNPFPMSIYDNIAYGPRTHGVHNKVALDEIVEKSLRGAAIWEEVKDRLRTSALGLSGGQQQSAHRQLLHRIGVGAGGIEYHDARLGAAVQGDIVDAGPGPGDGQKVFRKIIVQQLGGADQDGVLVCLRIGDGVQRRIQAVQADGRDLVECSDTVHGRMPPLGGPSGSRYLRGNVRCWHRFRRSIFYYR